MHSELVAAAAARQQSVRPGQIVPVTEPNRLEQVITAIAVREADGIPLVIDERWNDAMSASVGDIARARSHPGMAWATATSGSTGAPRILLRTARSWALSFPAVSELLELNSGDVMYLPSPASSSLTLFSVAHACAHGFALAIAARRTASANELADATVFHGTPSALRTIVDTGAGPRLRVALVGGAPLDRSLRLRAEARGIRVVAYYGAAEVSFVAVDTGDGMRPFPGVDVDIRNDELWVRSPNIAAAVLSHTGLPCIDALSGSPTSPVGLRSDHNGWVTVGDRASYRQDRIVLRGRSDDAILTAAATVIPADVEAALRDIDGIADAVVVGSPASQIGALVTAVVEPDGASVLPSSARLRSEAGARLPPTHLPRRWFVMDQLPRTPSGKPARAEVERLVLGGEVAAIA